MRRAALFLLCAAAARAHRPAAAAAKARTAPAPQTRRRALRLGGIAAVAFSPLAGYALDPRFPLTSEGAPSGDNPLTSRPLEWIRVKRQLEADETLGELADPNAKQTAARLADVLKLEDALRAVGADLDGPDGWRRAKATLATPAFATKAFKRAFNGYSDNVYYSRSDPDRANLYLLGGAPPSTAQTIAYLYRNDALDNVDRLRGEVDYLLESDGEGGPVDARAFYAAAAKAFDEYFKLCDPADRSAARAIAGPGGPRARAD